jgi:hypothetical protein
MMTYIGNGYYCYTDSTAMLLASIGETIPSARIEVLTGVGIGAFWNEVDAMLWFCSLATTPDRGISKALAMLGFEYTERSRQASDPVPFDQLRADLAKSPVALGPIDMGYLRYNPSCGKLAGVDHYVLAYHMDAQEISLHDPIGFPHVVLPLEQLELAWKAEQIDYRRGAYRCWTFPKRVRQPSAEEIYNQAMQYFTACYRFKFDTSPLNAWPTGRDAILAGADCIRNGTLAPKSAGFLVRFMFQLSARRALDFAAFFTPYNARLAKLKGRQAELFGRCHSHAVYGKWAVVADTLQHLADHEEEFQSTLLAS